MAVNKKTKNNARRVNYSQRAEKGNCPRCGDSIGASSRYKYCDSCREYFRDYMKEHNEAINALRKEHYAQRKQNNQCPKCGKKLGKKYTKKICAVCLEKQGFYNNKKNRIKKVSKSKPSNQQSRPKAKLAP